MFLVVINGISSYSIYLQGTVSYAKGYSGAFMFVRPCVRFCLSGMTSRLSGVAFALCICLLMQDTPRYLQAKPISVLVGQANGRQETIPQLEYLNEPFAVDFDTAGVMYVVEFLRGNRVMRSRQPIQSTTISSDLLPFSGVFHRATAKSKKSNTVNTQAGSAAEVRYLGMHDLAIGRKGEIYLADTFNHCIRVLNPETGTVTTLAGTGKASFSGDGGVASGAEFNQPYCCSLSPDKKRLLIADIRNQRLRSIDLGSEIITTLAGDGTRGKTIEGADPKESPLAGPRAACEASDGTTYLVLREGNALVSIKSGAIRTVVNLSGKKGFGGDNGPAAAAVLSGPKYVCMDQRQRVLIVDTENHCVRCFDPQTERISLVAGVPTEAGSTVGDSWTTTHLRRPHGVRMAPDGRLIIVDSENDRILIGPAPE